MATNDAPLTPANVTLTVRDLPGVADFYRRIVGLRDRHVGEETIALGTAARTLLVLRQDPAASVPPKTATGLYHTAFLLPARADLGSFMAHVKAQGVALTGAADHDVSEAVYLDDPEGNGIEVTADRPRSAWTVRGGQIHLTNTRLDAEGLAAIATPWDGAPTGTVVGHVHFKVGDLDASEAFWCQTLGFHRAHRMAKASFLGSGGYHHHIGLNTWHSEGFGPILEGAGLHSVTFDADAATFEGLATALDRPADAHHLTFEDPNGVAICVRPRGESASSAEVIERASDRTST